MNLRNLVRWRDDLEDVIKDVRAKSSTFEDEAELEDLKDYVTKALEEIERILEDFE